MATILSRLRAAAGPDVPFYGMTYFDPLLGNWLDGASGQAEAEATVPLLDELNAHLVADYSAAGAPSADVAGAFASDDFTLVDSPGERSPQRLQRLPVARHHLHPGATRGLRRRPSADGSRSSPGREFEAVIATLPAPPTTASTTEPAASTSAPTTTGRSHRATQHGAGRRARGRHATAHRLTCPPIDA